MAFGSFCSSSSQGADLLDSAVAEAPRAPPTLKVPSSIRWSTVSPDALLAPSQ
ncbi:MAG: hypothetical protein IPH38_20725 [Candidatus Microthrix sp.]|nr:hypothetical protein [Candidatus Microthrix sp.]MBK7021929.1 hypothetical protein [Candidatus Microthrix sp.]